MNHKIDSFDKSTIDELFRRSKNLRSSKSFYKMLNFTSRLRHYSLFNNALVYLQNPDVTYYATASHWRNAFGRKIKENAHPMVILAPMTPVLFVYDDKDTFGGMETPNYTEGLFVTNGQLEPRIFEKTIQNCLSYGIEVLLKPMPKSNAGLAMNLRFLERKHSKVKVQIHLNDKFNDESSYATLCHEIAHVLLGHLGNDSDEWWVKRVHLSRELKELEAEATSFLVTSRAGLETKSAEYLSLYISDESALKEISVKAIIMTAALIERMGVKTIPPKKHKKR